jgi:alkaline phosphatase
MPRTVLLCWLLVLGPLLAAEADRYLTTPVSGKVAATDSASAATALATGWKTASGNLSWRSGDPDDGALPTLAEQWRAQYGAAIGVVTTVPFNHATPAAFVAHNRHRDNYSPTAKGKDAQGPTLAEEILRTTRPEVVIGAGADPELGFVTAELLAEARAGGAYVVVTRQRGQPGAAALSTALTDATDGQGPARLLALFGGPKGYFEHPLPAHAPDHPAFRQNAANPSLAEAATAALELLARDPDGAFLLVEGGDIDWANHENNYPWLLGAMHQLDLAVSAVQTFIDRPDDALTWSNTLLVVTADHGTGGLRLNPEKPLGKGALPRIVLDDRNRNGELNGGEWQYPDGEVRYLVTGHLNELVTVAARGAGTAALAAREGQLYPGTRLLDNTDVNAALHAARAEYGARYVILFVGDGMGRASEVALSRYLHGTDDGLAWHAWPYRAWCTTWDVSSYNAHAKAAIQPAYDPTQPPTGGTNRPTLGYDPAQGGHEPPLW